MTEPLPRSPVNELADRFWEDFLEREPVYATMLGDERHDDKLGDPGPEGRARERAAYDAVLAGAGVIDRAVLGVEDRITLDMLETVARVGLAQLDQELHQLAAVDQMAGPQQIPGELAIFQRVDSAERLERLLARLAAYPAHMSAWEGVLRDAVSSGRMPASAVMTRTIDQVADLVATPVDEAPLLVRHPELAEDDRRRVRDALERHVLPAQSRFLEALRAAAPHVRGGDGIWSTPGGDAAYRTAILASTTIDATPRELHDFGLEQLEAIDHERLAIARELGHASIAELRTALDADPANRTTEPGRLVELARAQVERAAAAAPAWFGRLPKAACVVEAVEPFRERDSPGAFYLPPALDGSRPGMYYINTYQPESRPLHRLATTTFHEAVPGHHFQLAIEVELPGLHPFRTQGSRLAGVAYVEGWGLYSERLADEMGLFLNPQERFGMLDAQAFRAARLVVDTGIHAFRWERQRSVDLLIGIGLTPLEAETVTDRYAAWPGQALAYMTGQREILALRQELEARDGALFDLQRFHDEVLGHAALPLATLRHELPNWVKPRGT